MRTNFISYLFNFVVTTSKLFNIDESHSIKHSMDVFLYANNIYESELNNNPHLKNQKKIIDVSSILHDMCDKKYMDEKIGIQRIEEYIKDDVSDKELGIIKDIILRMSYSTVKKLGYPDLKEYQMAYHIVREADLLTSYDFERCIIYQMLKRDSDYDSSIKDAINVFENRVFKYHDDNLFITKYSINESKRLKIESLKKINKLKNIMKI